MLGKPCPYYLLVKVEHSGQWKFCVVLYANDKLVIRSADMSEVKAIAEANKMRGLLGLNNQYVIYYTVGGNVRSQRVEFPSIKDASAHANAHCPDGTTRIEVYEVEV